MKYLGIIIIGILTSFFFFPATLTFFPVANTKMLVSLLGIMIAVHKGISYGKGLVNWSVINISVYAALFSLCCFASTVYNSTWDYTYVTYFVTMWVWCMAAYAVCELIRFHHGKVTFDLVVHYLSGVCAAQCVIAILIDNNIFVHDLVNSVFYISSDFFEEGGRLYGIGCALDPAGIRFSGVLILLANLMCLTREKYSIHMFCYISAFAIIVIIGNMISRTTVIGSAIGLGYIAFKYVSSPSFDKRIWKWLVGFLVVLIPVMAHLYNADSNTRAYLRFGFEGFFSLVEKGYWETHSNNVLESMVVWPDEWKTWIIGDGYLLSPWSINPYYTGDDYGFFYKNTDIGYCRFIFYCGVIGLAAFSLFFVRVTLICMQLFPKRKLTIFLILVLNFLVWAKVATDIFPVYAMLFFTDQDEEDDVVADEVTDESANSQSKLPLTARA